MFTFTQRCSHSQAISSDYASQCDRVYIFQQLHQYIFQERILWIFQSGTPANDEKKKLSVEKIELLNDLCFIAQKYRKTRTQMTWILNAYIEREKEIDTQSNKKINIQNPIEYLNIHVIRRMSFLICKAMIQFLFSDLFIFNWNVGNWLKKCWQRFSTNLLQSVRMSVADFFFLYFFFSDISRRNSDVKLVHL